MSFLKILPLLLKSNLLLLIWWIF